MHCPDLVDSAVKNGFIGAKDVNEKDFSPADVYSPSTELSTRREWRVLSLLAPEASRWARTSTITMSVKPDHSSPFGTSSQGDWYAGTSFDLSQVRPAVGNPIRFANSSRRTPTPPGSAPST